MNFRFFTTSTIAFVLLTSQTSFAAGHQVHGVESPHNPGPIVIMSAETQRAIVSEFEMAKALLEEQLEILKTKIETATTEAQRTAYIRAGRLHVEKFLVTLYRNDLSLTRTQIDEIARYKVQANGGFTAEQAILSAPTVLVSVIGVTFGLDAVKNILLSAKHVIFKPIAGQFARADIGVIRKLLYSVRNVGLAAAGNFILISVEGAAAFYAGTHVYGLYMSRAELDAQIANADVRIQSMAAELNAIDLRY